MSERFWNNLSVVVLAIVATTGGTYFGMREGRAEMKHWQDSYYAGHPVVKEVHPTFTFDTAGQSYQCIVNDSTHLVCDGRLFQNTVPAPPKKAKPVKASKRQPSAWTIPIPEKEPQGSVYTPGLAPDAARCTEVGGTWHRWYRNTNGEYSYEGQGYCEPAAKP